MTEERFEEIMEESYKYDHNFKGDTLFEGLKIMSKYTNDLCGGADHDIVYGPDIPTLVEAGIKEEEVRKLNILNWHVVDGEYVATHV
jgi:hypothetical protein